MTQKENWIAALDNNIEYAEKMAVFKNANPDVMSMDTDEKPNILGFHLFQGEDILYDGLLGKISYAQVNGIPEETQRHVYMTTLPRLVVVNPLNRADYRSVNLPDKGQIYLHTQPEADRNFFSLCLKEGGDTFVNHFYPRDMTLAKIWVDLCLQHKLCTPYTGVLEVHRPVVQGIPLFKEALRGFFAGKA
eukprot:gene32072-39616_t